MLHYQNLFLDLRLGYWNHKVAISKYLPFAASQELSSNKSAKTGRVAISGQLQLI
jgi:hypothetical protein